MSYSDAKTQPRPIAEIVREKTNDGELIVEFLVDMVLGKIEGATLWHRLEATRQLEKLGLQLPQAVKQAISPPVNGHKPSRTPAKPRQNDDLADIVKQETGDGKDIVRFLVNVMNGKIEGVKVHHRLAAARELLKLAFVETPVVAGDDEVDETVAREQAHNPKPRNTKRCNDEDDPFNFDHYSHEDLRRDWDGKRALLHIFGGEEGMQVAIRAKRKHWDKIRASELPGEFDRTPVENPGDDPFGKECYGYRCLKMMFQDNNAIRVANKAALEFHKRRYEHLINEDGSLNDQVDTASLDPKTLEYLERNRHLLAEKHQPPEPPVGEGFRPSRDPDKPLLPKGEGWGEGETPIARPPSNPQLPGESEATHKPSRKYGHCRDCSETVAEDYQPSGDPDKPPAEHDSERPHDTPVGEGFKPSREPPHVILSEAEGPPAPEPPPRKKRLNIHLGPPSEDDPPDEDSRRYRDPDEIRVPLRNLSSTTISLL